MSPSSHYQQQGTLFSGHYHLPRRRRHHQLRPSAKYFTSHRADGPAASNRCQRRGALFLATTTNSGVITPSVPTSWDLFRGVLYPPRRWACSFIPLPTAPSVTSIVGYFGPSIPPTPPTTPSSLPRKKLTPPPRAPQASPLAHFKGLLHHQRLRLHVRCGTRTFHRRVCDPTPSSTNHIELLQPRFLPSQSSYRIVREHPVLTGSCSELSNAFYWTIIRLQSSYHIFRKHYDVTVSRSERCSTP